MATTKELYRVRKSWADSKSQLGAYNILKNAQHTCDTAGIGYHVFNSKGEIVYSAQEKKSIIDTSKVNSAAIDEKVMWDYFKNKGLNDCGIAGLMGNLYAESAFRPCNLQRTYEISLGMSDEEYTAAVDAGTYTNFVNDKAGYGLAQWTYHTLKQEMYNYMKKKGKSIGDGNAQMDFLVKQLSTDYKSVWTTLQTAKTVLEASNEVLMKFERPADQGPAVQKKRADYGQVYYDKYAKTEIQVPKKGANGKMKYSGSNKPLCCMQTQSSCYKNTSIMTVKGVLWHSTDANNPMLKRYIQPSDNALDKEQWLELLGKNQYGNDWNHVDVDTGLNFWIGKLADNSVTSVQTMPWNYRPWGCGSGPKGSCNNGWIQFEICEGSLTDKDYFNKVYEEACQMTAYLCNMYNIDPYGTVEMNGVKVPTILCHQDAYKLGFGSNHPDIDHWFVKHNKTMADVRDDVAKLLGKYVETKVEEPEQEMYRVRKTWEDAKSQIGAYTILDNAKAACDKAGKDYEVYNSKGIAIYPEVVAIEDKVESAVPAFEIGAAVSIIPGSTYADGKPISSWVFKTKLYIRNAIDKDGKVYISLKPGGSPIGMVKATSLVPYTETPVIIPESSSVPVFNPYIVKINADVLNVRSGPSTRHRITTQVKKHGLYTIVAEDNGWGKLKSGVGWIYLDYTQKV